METNNRSSGLNGTAAQSPLVLLSVELLFFTTGLAAQGQPLQEAQMIAGGSSRTRGYEVILQRS